MTKYLSVWTKRSLQAVVLFDLLIKRETNDSHNRKDLASYGIPFLHLPVVTVTHVGKETCMWTYVVGFDKRYKCNIYVTLWLISEIYVT